jgi:transcriptional regulator with XRE-family HTH domain
MTKEPQPHAVARRQAGLTQRQAAEALGVSLPTYKRLEQRPPAELLFGQVERMSEVFRLPLHVVVGASDYYCRRRRNRAG